MKALPAHNHFDHFTREIPSIESLLAVVKTTWHDDQIIVRGNDHDILTTITGC